MRCARELCLTTLFAIVASVSCGCPDNQPPNNGQATNGGKTDPGADSALGKTAAEIAKGVGEVRETDPDGSKGTVFVFEEYHTSRLGQLEIAVMLLRLHDEHNLRLIGLEGAVQSARALDASWFHNAGGAAAAGAREDVAVRMVAEGEISAVEFATLVFPDVQVQGLERSDLYDVKPDTETNPEVAYLIAIAEKKLSQSDIRKINELVEADKPEEALEYILKSDPWVRQQFEALKNTDSISIEDMARRLRQIRDKARQVGATIEPKVEEDLEKTLKFYEVAIQRSEVMVDRLAQMIRENPGDRPVAINIGAGHSTEMLRMLKSRDFSYRAGA